MLSWIHLTFLSIFAVKSIVFTVIAMPGSDAFCDIFCVLSWNRKRTLRPEFVICPTRKRQKKRKKKPTRHWMIPWRVKSEILKRILVSPCSLHLWNAKWFLCFGYACCFLTLLNVSLLLFDLVYHSQRGQTGMLDFSLRLCHLGSQLLSGCRFVCLFVSRVFVYFLCCILVFFEFEIIVICFGFFAYV